MPLPDHLAADLIFQLGTSYQASCRLYYTKSAGTITLANANAVADAIKAHFQSDLANCLTTAAKFNDVRFRYTESGTEIEGTATDLGTVGVVAGETLPEHDAVCIRRKTSTTGRARRGRIFLPFVPEAYATDTGELNGDGLTAYASFADLLNNNIVSGGTGVTLTPVQPSPSLGILLPITKLEIVVQICTRRDRQAERKRTIASVT